LRQQLNEDTDKNKRQDTTSIQKQDDLYLHAGDDNQMYNCIDATRTHASTPAAEAHLMTKVLFYGYIVYSYYTFPFIR